MNCFNLRFFVLSFFILQLFGCASTKITLEHIPMLETGSPLRGITSMKFLIQDFKYEKEKPSGPTTHRTALMQFYAKELPKQLEEEAKPGEVVGAIYASGLLGEKLIYLFVTDRSASDFIKHAIGNELRRNGHYILEPQYANEADITIEGIITQFNWTGVKVNITISIPSTNEHLLTKSYIGPGVPQRGIGQKPYITSFTSALSNLIKEFTTDIEFINQLKKVNESK